MIQKDVKTKMYGKWQWRRNMRMREALDFIAPGRCRLDAKDENGFYLDNYFLWATWSVKLGIYVNEG